MYRVSAWSLLLPVAIGCASTGQIPSNSMTALERQTVEQEVRAAALAYAGAFALATCDKPDTLLRFFDVSTPNLYVSDASVATIPPAVLLQHFRKGACERSLGAVTVEEIAIEVHSRELASVGSVFVNTDSARVGAVTERGASFQIFRRTSAGWQLTGGMSVRRPAAQR